MVTVIMTLSLPEEFGFVTVDFTRGSGSLVAPDVSGLKDGCRESSRMRAACLPTVHVSVTVSNCEQNY